MISHNKNTINAYVVCAVFLIVLILPTLLFPFIKEYIDTENHENRELAPKPEFNVEEYNEFPDEYENYFNDHLAFKNQFVKANAFIDMHLFKKLSSDKVILGKDNWLFYKNTDDGDPLSCYKGTNLLTEDELKVYADILTQTSENLKIHGKEFVLLLAPNKEQVYSEYMPSNVKVISDFSRCDQLYKYLTENTNVKVVYPFKEMLQEKSNHQLYHKYDTHWNSLGSFIGEQQLLEVLTGERLYLDDINYYSDGKANCDLATMAKITEMLPKQQNIRIEDYHKGVSATLTEQTDGEFYQKYVSNSKNDQKALILGDSFRSEMTKNLPCNFAETVFIHYDYVDKETFNPLDSDVIILETVERYLPHIERHCSTINNGIAKNLH